MKQHTIQLLLAFFAGMIAYKMFFSREGFGLSDVTNLGSDVLHGRTQREVADAYLGGVSRGVNAVRSEIR